MGRQAGLLTTAISSMQNGVDALRSELQEGLRTQESTLQMQVRNFAHVDTVESLTCSLEVMAEGNQKIQEETTGLRGDVQSALQSVDAALNAVEASSCRVVEGEERLGSRLEANISQVALIEASLQALHGKVEQMECVVPSKLETELRSPPQLTMDDHHENNSPVGTPMSLRSVNLTDLSSPVGRFAELNGQMSSLAEGQEGLYQIMEALGRGISGTEEAIEAIHSSNGTIEERMARRMESERRMTTTALKEMEVRILSHTGAPPCQ